MNTYKIRISPKIAFLMSVYFEDCAADDEAYGFLKSEGFPAGTFEVSEKAMDEYQSWSSFQTESSRGWIETDGASALGEYNAMLAFYKQTVALIGLRHHIG